MKVPIVHLCPSLGGGGAERQLSMLALEQRSRGYDVHVAVRRGGGVHEQRLREAGVALHALGDHKSISPLLLANAHALLGSIRPRLAQTWLPQMDVVGGIAAKLNSTPWILSERSSRLAFKRFAVVEMLRGRVARGAAAIVANSAGGVEYWRTRLGTRAAIFRIGNAIDFDGVHRAVRGDSRNADLDAAGRILIVGRLSQEKSIGSIVTALAAVASELELKATIIGDGPLRDQIGALVIASGLQGRCTMLPFQINWWSMLASARMLVSMSRYEGHPNVVLEAAAAGCPLVVSDIPAHREFLDERSAILVPTHEQTRLVAAIRAISIDPDSARKRAERAAERVRSLTIAATADAYEAVYGTVLEQR